METAFKENKIFQGMSRKATFSDNVTMENSFGILKQEYIMESRWLPATNLRSKLKTISIGITLSEQKKLTSLISVEYRTQTSQWAA